MNNKPSISTLFRVGIIVSFFLAGAIRLMEPLLDHFPHLPDQGASWYYWKLPAPTFWGRFTAWSGYILHQLTVWVLIFQGRKDPGKRSRRLFLANFLFILLHMAQSYFFYDGLAQDVSVWSSQYSVIGMLVLILILLAPARGFFFGKKVRLRKEVISFFRKYHGYYISWALVYTFWFHPMDGEWRLVPGFLYMFFLFIQMSLAGTPLHSRIGWITLLEVFVAFHGVTVALLSGQEAWPMFLFGFLMLFVLTQLYGLKWPLWSRLVLQGGYIAGVVVVYSFRGFERLFELSFIPVTLYGVAFLLVGLGYGFSFLRGKKKGQGG